MQQNPILSGNFKTYMYNQLLEIIVLNNLVPKGRNYRATLESSPIFSELTDIMALIEKRFIEPCNLIQLGRQKTKKFPRKIDDFADKTVGVLYSKLSDCKGQKPSVRADFGLCSVGYPFFIHGGQGSKLFSDIREFSVDGNLIEWKLTRTDGDDFNF